MVHPSIDIEPLTQLVEQTFPHASLKQVTAMAGGMSKRRFFRVTLEGAQPHRSARLPESLVATFTPNAGRSDEITQGEPSKTQEWPFLEIQRTLAQVNVRVPRVWGQDCDAGWLLLEDLGDLTLAETLRLHPDAKDGLYKIAVHDLAHAQQRLDVLPPNSIVRTRRFDASLLQWEIEHFREYALDARGITLSAQQSETYGTLATALANRVASLPYAFVHRDYQSRNLMWVQSAGTAFTPSILNGELAWVDFQDALMGPRVYDLVALLNDSYQTFSRDFVEQRLREFTLERGLPEADVAQIIREFDTTTVQRKLKDAGRFVFFQTKNGDDSYLRFVEPTITKIKDSLARLQDDPLFREWSALLNSLV
jgi:N-acetylmuramate 1-kinase